MNARKLLVFAPLLLVLVALWGCTPDNPGWPLANQAPDTRITVAPLDSSEHDHYVSPSVMFHVQWFGHDPDGLVAGFWIQVDNGAEVWTTKGDSAIAFEAANPDPNDPTRLLGTHTLKISAVDDEGARDPSPAIRTILAVNYPPVLDRIVADFPDSAATGAGIYFEVEWSDPNVSGALFRLSINGLPVSDWDARSKYQFYDASDASILASIEQGEVMPLDVSLLTVGVMNTLSVEVMDFGGAISAPIERHVEVIDTVYPALTEFSVTYGAAQFFPDGSIFYRENRSTTLTMVGSAADYYGAVHSYRYRQRQRSIGDTTWTEWNEWSGWGEPSAEFSNLPVGEYQFEAQCRDYAGVPGDTLAYTLSIVEPDLDLMNILIIDETKDGNGRPGSPDDQQCDDFYNNITAPLEADGWTIFNIDYATHKVGDENYISPRDLFDKRIVIWHADDRSQLFLGDNLTVLGQYLDAGGRFILSGHNVLGAFTDDDIATFTSGFAHDYLRIAGGQKNDEKEFIGMIGEPDLGCPDVAYDPAKIPGSWHGVNYTWILTPEHRTEAGGYWHGDPDDTSFEGGVSCLMNFSPVNPWRTIVLGFPLYFTMEDQATSFMQWMIGQIDPENATE